MNFQSLLLYCNICTWTRFFSTLHSPNVPHLSVFFVAFKCKITCVTLLLIHPYLLYICNGILCLILVSAGQDHPGSLPGQVQSCGLTDTRVPPWNKQQNVINNNRNNVLWVSQSAHLFAPPWWNTSYTVLRFNWDRTFFMEQIQKLCKMVNFAKQLFSS